MSDEWIQGKLIIFSAPSGAGKTTIVRRLLNGDFNLEFSISACSRARRDNETNGKDYYFITADEFRKKIAQGEFIEWEEVYPDHFYGTLKREVERIRQSGKHVVFDIDVMGGINIRRQFGNEALAIFIMPPSVEELERRLRIRNTDSDEKIRERISKAGYEMSFAHLFDVVIVNEELEKTISEVSRVLEGFLGSR
jgi:guanylate kinase